MYVYIYIYIHTHDTTMILQSFRGLFWVDRVLLAALGIRAGEADLAGACAGFLWFRALGLQALGLGFTRFTPKPTQCQILLRLGGGGRREKLRLKKADFGSKGLGK